MCIVNLWKQADLPYQLALLGQPFLLAADMDGTMLGDRQGEAWLKALKEASAGEFLLAYVTGRNYQAIMKPVEEGRLPRPDFICGEVGTIIVDLNDPRNLLGEKYAAQVGPGWDVEAIFALGIGNGVTRQPPPYGQCRFKASFDWDGRPGSLEGFYRRTAGLEGCTILPSHGAYIDVLPGALGKGRAVEFLQQALGLDPRRVVVAGDSGNDREMFETNFQGIVPANALDELKEIATQPRHYHSPLPAGRGVLDGLEHFGLLEKPPMHVDRHA